MTLPFTLTIKSERIDINQPLFQMLRNIKAFKGIYRHKKEIRESLTMNGESTFKPNFTVDDVPTSESNLGKEYNKATSESTDFAISPSEEDLIKKKRHKLRLNDPEGVYTFRHIEIGYFHSFIHVISLLIALFLIISFYLLVIEDTQQIVTGVGYVSDINLLDKLSMSFIAVYGFLKIKSTLFTKMSKFDIRYRIALCVNALNRIIVNYLKLIFIYSTIALTSIQVYSPNQAVSDAFRVFENGVLADTISIIIWFISITIVIKAFKYCGKGED